MERIRPIVLAVRAVQCLQALPRFGLRFLHEPNEDRRVEGTFAVEVRRVGLGVASGVEQVVLNGVLEGDFSVVYWDSSALTDVHPWAAAHYCL